jgi:hypothetical protein
VRERGIEHDDSRSDSGSSKAIDSHVIYGPVTVGPTTISSLCDDYQEAASLRGQGVFEGIH